MPLIEKQKYPYWEDGSPVLNAKIATELGAEFLGLIKHIGLPNFLVCVTTATLSHVATRAEEHLKAGVATRESIYGMRRFCDDLCKLTEVVAPDWEHVVQSWGDAPDDDPPAHQNGGKDVIN